MNHPFNELDQRNRELTILNAIAHELNGSADLSAALEAARLDIEDDGCGFDPAELPGKRFGLVGLIERVRLLGGHLHLESSPGRGTRISAVIPLEAVDGA